MKSALTLAAGLVLSAPVWGVPTETDVLSHYADIAQAKYADALSTAKALGSAVDQLIAEPTETRLEATRQAWIAARAPYQQTEVYRFGNTIVDAWEGRINAWPLDEGLID